ncbi:MAG: hypothetical protein K0M45_03725 [Candidatus Paracaedibacteraceae bacterium]|nr:hypothetical protein [Candidatus Paracaedibacteraceae bacterium]
MPRTRTRRFHNKAAPFCWCGGPCWCPLQEALCSQAVSLAPQETHLPPQGWFPPCGAFSFLLSKFIYVWDWWLLLQSVQNQADNYPQQSSICIDKPSVNLMNTHPFFNLTSAKTS